MDRGGAKQAFSIDTWFVDIVNALRVSLAASAAETAHLKAIGWWEGFPGVANLIASDTPAVLSLASNCAMKTADVVVNARVAMAPSDLQSQVEQAVEVACERIGVVATLIRRKAFVLVVSCLRTGRPLQTRPEASCGNSLLIAGHRRTRRMPTGPLLTRFSNVHPCLRRIQDFQLNVNAKHRPFDSLHRKLGAINRPQFIDSHTKLLKL